MSPLTIVSLYRMFSPYAPFAWCYVGAMIFWPVWQGWHNDYQASIHAVVQWMTVWWQGGDRFLTSWISNRWTVLPTTPFLELGDAGLFHRTETAWNQEFY